MATRRIAVLHHGEAPLFERPYLIRLLIPEWEARGWSVRVVEDPRKPEPAEIAVLHVDLTRVPDRWLEVAARYERVINGALHDISKVRVSDPAIREGDGWEGPVIVKTNLNHAGTPERHLRARRLSGGVPLLARALRLLLRWRERWRGFDPHVPYPVFPHPHAVPRELRNDPAFVVQRFLPERDGELYVARMITFLGERAVGGRLLSKSPVVKAAEIVAATTEEAPADVLRRARAFGADYGKVDYVEQAGQRLIFDVNRTPTYSGSAPSERVRQMVKVLAGGIEEWVRK